jgi:hypothetical protein
LFCLRGFALVKKGTFRASEGFFAASLVINKYE